MRTCAEPTAVRTAVRFDLSPARATLIQPTICYGRTNEGEVVDNATTRPTLHRRRRSDDRRQPLLSRIRFRTEERPSWPRECRAQARSHDCVLAEANQQRVLHRCLRRVAA